MTVEVIPSLPALSFQELSTKVALVCGAVNTFQIDVADGMFVTNRSWPLHREDRAQFERLMRGGERLPCAEKMRFEVHFMAHHPEKLLREWVKVGIIRALFHVESRHDFSTLRALAEPEGMELGLALKLGTPVSRVAEYLPYITSVQVMGIDPIGAQGRPFDERALSMVADIKMQFPDVIISVDGAVNAETAPRLIRAGASRLAPGSYVFRSENPHHAVQTLASLHP